MMELSVTVGHAIVCLIARKIAILSALSYSLRTQTYFRLSLGSAENNVCEPESRNDFCDVIAIVYSLANQIP